MKVSFRVLSQIMLINGTVKQTDQAYLAKAERIKQDYLYAMTKLRYEFDPYYRSINQELQRVLQEVEEETGLDLSSGRYVLLETGDIVPSGYSGSLLM